MSTGTAFTRSFGDSIAEELGVFAEPETLKYEMTSADQYLIVASDGVWEFLTNKQVVSITRAADSPQDAAQVLWKVISQDGHLCAFSLVSITLFKLASFCFLRLHLFHFI